MVGASSTELPQGGEPFCTIQASQLRPRGSQNFYWQDERARMLGWAPCTGGWGTAAFSGNTPHCSCSSGRCLRDLGQRREEGTVPRYPTDGLGLISACVVVSAMGSVMEQIVWQGSLGLLFLPLPFSPPPRSNSPGLSINCHRGSRGF